MKKVAVVTGGASGIGLAVVKKLLSQGYTVAVLDIAPLPKQVVADYHACDLTDYRRVTDTIQQIVKTHDSIGYLFSNAGVHLSATLEDTSVEDIDRVINTNLKSALFTLKAILPHMRARQFGRIVLNSSEQAMVGKPNSGVYGATKAAIAQLAKSTALDYARDNILVNAICSGTIDTPLYQKAIERYCQKTGAKPEQVHQAEADIQPVGRIGQPAEVANLAAFLLSDEATFMTGTNVFIDGGYTAR